MKNLALVAIFAFGTAVPTLVAAQDHGSIHSERALAIFAQIASEETGDSDK